MLADSFRTIQNKQTLNSSICWNLGKAGTVGRVSERSYNTTICPIFIIWHISIAYFGYILFQIIAWGISDMKLLD